MDRGLVVYLDNEYMPTINKIIYFINIADDNKRIRKTY